MNRRSWLAVLLVLLALPAAAAHAEIASVEPPSGARLDAAPAMVRLELTGPVERSNLVLRVTDQDGRRADLGDVEISGHDRPVVTVSLEPALPDGAYLISLTATSLEDGHRITYTRSFAVGGFVPFDTQDAAELVDAVGAAARAVAYLGLGLVVGGLVLGVRLGWPARLVQPVRAGAGAAAAGSAWLLALSQREAQQGWSAFLDTQVGIIMAARAALAGAVLLVAMALPPRNGRRAAALAIAVLLAAIATARFTHASTRGPGAIANDVLHMLAAGAWVGGLLLLLWLWLDRDRDPVADARAFSTPALVAVIGIAMTGIIASLLVLPLDVLRSPATLLGSPYGSFLAGKVALALAMVGVAAVNRYVLLHQEGEAGIVWLRRLAAATKRPWLRPAHSSGDPRHARQGLARLVGAEALMGLVVLALAGLLLSTSPPAAAVDDGLRLTGEGDDFLVTAIIDPEPRAGASSTMRFFIQYTPDHPDAPGEVVANGTCGGSGCVQVLLEDADATVSESHIAVPEGGGWWSVELLWPRSGAFDVTVQVSTEWVFRDDIVLPVTVA